MRRRTLIPSLMPMRTILLVAVMVGGCADTGAPDVSPDAHPTDDGETIQFPEDGNYDVEWLSGSGCDSITLSDGTFTLDACGLSLDGSELEYCRRFEGGVRDWHLCPNVGHLHGQIREGYTVKAEFRAWPH